MELLRCVRCFCVIQIIRSGDLPEDITAAPSSGKVPGNLGLLMGEYEKRNASIMSSCTRATWRRDQSLDAECRLEYIVSFKIDNSYRTRTCRSRYREKRVSNGRTGKRVNCLRLSVATKSWILYSFFLSFKLKVDVVNQHAKSMAEPITNGCR